MAFPSTYTLGITSLGYQIVWATLAMRSDSERMREVVNKKLTTEAIHEAARHAKQGGLSGLKLYGMVGLPTESDDDVDTTAELLLALKKSTAGLRFTLGVSTMIIYWCKSYAEDYVKFDKI